MHAEHTRRAKAAPSGHMFQETVHEESWRVEAFELDGDGHVNVCISTGPRAEQIARHVAKLLQSQAVKSSSGDGAG
jgi:hypothetical protein